MFTEVWCKFVWTARRWRAETPKPNVHRIPWPNFSSSPTFAPNARIEGVATFCLLSPASFIRERPILQMPRRRNGKMRWCRCTVIWWSMTVWLNCHGDTIPGAAVQLDASVLLRTHSVRVSKNMVDVPSDSFETMWTVLLSFCFTSASDINAF